MTQLALPAPVARRAALTLGVLTAINLLNYLDRYVLAGMLPLVQEHFGRSDEQMGILSSSFILVYALVSPFTGFVGDRVPRKWLVAGGVVLWSAATVWSGLSRSFGELLLARSLIGIGEAGYAAVSPGIISDLYGEHRRGRMLALFYAALPVGSAIGFTVGGALGSAYGWRAAFFIAGAPGILLGLLALLLPEPKRGAAEYLGEHRVATVGETLRALRRIPSYWVDTAGYTAATFAMGGLAAWWPTFLYRERGLPLDKGSFLFGALLVVAGFLGTLAGGWLGDRLHRSDKGAHFVVSGWGLLLATPLAVLAVLSADPAVYWPAVFACLFFLFFNTAPLNAALCNVVPASMRSAAVAINVLFIHVLGDAISPWLMGRLSDASSLQNGLLLACAAIALGGAILVTGSGVLRKDGRVAVA
jgi:predicted MFS family arabinose efflux permease